MRPGSKIDKALLGVVSIGLATPAFFVATLMIFYFAVKLKWLPAFGYVSFVGFARADGCATSSLLHSSLSIIGAAEIARQLRTGLVGVAQEDYIRAAEARGLSPATRHGQARAAKRCDSGADHPRFAHRAPAGRAR